MTHQALRDEQAELLWMLHTKPMTRGMHKLVRDLTVNLEVAISIPEAAAELPGPGRDRKEYLDRWVPGMGQE